MIKTIGLLTRKDGWTHEQFMKHWVEIHAPLAHAVPGLRRYVQNHITGERTRADIPATAVEIDGIAELWFDDQAALDTAARSPEKTVRGCSGPAVIPRAARDLSCSLKAPRFARVTIIPARCRRPSPCRARRPALP